MPIIRFEFINGISRENEVPEGFAAKYSDIEKHEQLVNRKETRRHQSLEKSLEHGWDIADTRVNIAEEIESKETNAELFLALTQLTKKQRIILISHAVHRRAFREIGNLLGISKETAREHYLSAIKKLKNFLR